MKTVQAITFFDLDGTLLNDKSHVSSEVSAAIKQLKQNNILPIIATGRSLIEIRTIMQESGIHSAILMNGQYVQMKGKEIYSSLFTYKEITDFWTHVQGEGMN